MIYVGEPFCASQMIGAARCMIALLQHRVDHLERHLLPQLAQIVLFWMAFTWRSCTV
jgi:hypothetical protein